MTLLADVVDLAVLAEMEAAGYVSRRLHPVLPLEILNYTHRCQYDRAWNDVTRACRGLIVSLTTGELVARPWPKFHNYGELVDPELHDRDADGVILNTHAFLRDGSGALDLGAPVEVTDKLDGSLGILYPEGDLGWAVATRGSFESEQARHATGVYVTRYEQDALWAPPPGWTFLFEIVYPSNRVVVDYGAMDDLVLLGAVETDSGHTIGPTVAQELSSWPGPAAQVFAYATLAEALSAPLRPSCEGLVVRYPGRGLMVKVKQDDYVALHRILTGLNARNVWEVEAVRACSALIREPKHWGSYLGIDPARAEEVLALDGDSWLANVPDEFYGWVNEVAVRVRDYAAEEAVEAMQMADAIAGLDRRARYERVKDNAFCREILRAAEGKGTDSIVLRAWREVCPAPEAPFAARDEAVA